MFLLKFVTCVAWLAWALFVSLGSMSLAGEYTRGVLLTTWAVFVFGPPVILWGISEAARAMIADSKRPRSP